MAKQLHQYFDQNDNSRKKTGHQYNAAGQKNPKKPIWESWGCHIYKAWYSFQDTLSSKGLDLV